MERRRIVKRQKKDGRSAGEGQIPPAVRNQLARLFGTSRAEAISTSRSTVQWRRTLQAVLTELDRYRRANVRADQFHEISLCAALSSAREALRTEDFWPGYVEGITRFALLLMGDYLDHHSRKTGKRRSDHYDLSRQRTLLYMQDYRQQKRTLFAAWKVFGLPKSFDEVISEFRAQHGYAATDADFIQWFKRNYAAAYTTVF